MKLLKEALMCLNASLAEDDVAESCYIQHKWLCHPMEDCPEEGECRAIKENVEALEEVSWQRYRNELYDNS